MRFEIIPKLYRTIKLAGYTILFYKSKCKFSRRYVMVLKPYHSYTFKINNTFLLKDIDKYYVISSIKLSIVNINDTEILSTSDTSIPNNLTINIPYNSNLYDTNNKLYFKLECEFAQQDNLINKLKQGYYLRTNTGDALKQ